MKAFVSASRRSQDNGDAIEQAVVIKLPVPLTAYFGFGRVNLAWRNQ